MILTQVKAPIVYERLWDNRPKRTIDDHIQILKDLNADMIFRSNWRFYPLYDSCSNVNIPPDKYQLCIDSGYSRDQQTQIISTIKQNIPGITIIGAVPAQKINKIEINTLTGEVYPDTYYMALDPAKWGIISPTKDQLQQQMTKTVAAGGYFPDITNYDYQELLMSWIQEQAMTGATGIWIDLLYTQAQIMYGYTHDINHPAVRDAYFAANSIIAQVHELGILVGTWDNPAANYSKFYGTTPQLDFVTGTPSTQEVQTMTTNTDEWTSRIQIVRDVFGNIPYFIFIDWGGSESQTVAFANLGTQQGIFLSIINDFCQSNGLKFIFPVHGGNLVGDWYDAKVQETYDSIKSIMTSTTGSPPPLSSKTKNLGMVLFTLALVGAYLMFKK